MNEVLTCKCGCKEWKIDGQVVCVKCEFVIELADLVRVDKVTIYPKDIAVMNAAISGE